MTRILAAGDHFVLPEMFEEALRARVAGDVEVVPLTLEWPIEPFGPVDGVLEASGTAADIIAALGDAEIAVTQMGAFTAEVFRACPQLRFVGVCRGGPVNVDLAAATEAGVVVSFTPGRNAAAAAEFAVGMILAAMRRLTSADAELHAGIWRGDYYTYANAGTELGDSTVGLVGYGAISRLVARILRAFGAEVLAYDPYVEAADADGVELVDLDDLMRRSDVVSLHARLTDETRHLIDRRRLDLLPHGAVLVNTARGGLLDYAPLPEMLESGRLGALALDVYDVEPPPADWPLLSSPRVVLSPHLAGATRQTAMRAAAITADETARFLRGERCLHVANPEVLDRQESGRS